MVAHTELNQVLYQSTRSAEVVDNGIQEREFGMRYRKRARLFRRMVTKAYMRISGRVMIRNETSVFEGQLAAHQVDTTTAIFPLGRAALV